MSPDSRSGAPEGAHGTTPLVGRVTGGAGIPGEPSDDGTDDFPLGALDRLTVLVVEDDHVSRQALEIIFAYYGARVLSAESAREALSCYERTRPSIVVSDVGLPDSDGCVLLRSIRDREFGHGRRTPAIAVSSTENSERARGAGFDAFLPKPIDVGALLRMVHALTSPG